MIRVRSVGRRRGAETAPEADASHAVPDPDAGRLDRR